MDGIPTMTDLEKHDARFHPGGYKPGDTCTYRETHVMGRIPNGGSGNTEKTEQHTTTGANVRKGDEADKIDSSSGKVYPTKSEYSQMLEGFGENKLKALGHYIACAMNRERPTMNEAEANNLNAAYDTFMAEVRKRINGTDRKEGEFIDLNDGGDPELARKKYVETPNNDDPPQPKEMDSGSGSVQQPPIKFTPSGVDWGGREPISNPKYPFRPNEDMKIDGKGSYWQDRHPVVYGMNANGELVKGRQVDGSFVPESKNDDVFRKIKLDPSSRLRESARTKFYDKTKPGMVVRFRNGCYARKLEDGTWRVQHRAKYGNMFSDSKYTIETSAELSKRAGVKIVDGNYREYADVDDVSGARAADIMENGKRRLAGDGVVLPETWDPDKPKYGDKNMDESLQDIWNGIHKTPKPRGTDDFYKEPFEPGAWGVGKFPNIPEYQMKR